MSAPIDVSNLGDILKLGCIGNLCQGHYFSVHILMIGQTKLVKVLLPCLQMTPRFLVLVRMPVKNECDFEIVGNWVSVNNLFINVNKCERIFFGPRFFQ